MGTNCRLIFTGVFPCRDVRARMRAERSRTKGQNQLDGTAAPEAIPVAQVPKSMMHGSVVLLRDGGE